MTALILAYMVPIRLLETIFEGIWLFPKSYRIIVSRFANRLCDEKSYFSESGGFGCCTHISILLFATESSILVSEVARGNERIRRNLRMNWSIQNDISTRPEKSTYDGDYASEIGISTDLEKQIRHFRSFNDFKTVHFFVLPSWQIYGTDGSSFCRKFSNVS